jgi:pimeloyl-ACP methyl ester carboxylesterase
MIAGGKLLLTSLLLSWASAATAQKIPYGNNPQAGKYINAGDAKIYYEVYGQGEPFVLLHGGVYGYIDEFEPFINRLSEKFQVICIATRGHGKSEIGTEPFSYKQRAEDACKVIRSITKDSVTMLGFSDGGFSALKFASIYPDVVKKLIVIGVADKPNDPSAKKFDYSVEGLMKYDSVFFSNRLKLMPEPARWAECLSKLNKMYNEDPVSNETFEKIKCPVLVMSGDRDSYNSVETVVRCAKAIRGSSLSIIPGCHHVVFFCNFPAVWESVKPFLGIK